MASLSLSDEVKAVFQAIVSVPREDVGIFSVRNS